MLNSVSTPLWGSLLLSAKMLNPTIFWLSNPPLRHLFLICTNSNFHISSPPTPRWIWLFYSGIKPSFSIDVQKTPALRVQWPCRLGGFFLADGGLSVVYRCMWFTFCSIACAGVALLEHSNILSLYSRKWLGWTPGNFPKLLALLCLGIWSTSPLWCGHPNPSVFYPVTSISRIMGIDENGKTSLRSLSPSP